MNKIILNYENVKNWKFYKIKVHDQYRNNTFHRIYASPKDSSPQNEKYLVYKIDKVGIFSQRRRFLNIKTKKQKKIDAFKKESLYYGRYVLHFGLFISLINSSENEDVLIHDYRNCCELNYSDLVNNIDIILEAEEYWDYPSIYGYKKLPSKEYVWTMCYYNLRKIMIEERKSKEPKNILRFYQVYYIGSNPIMNGVEPSIVAATSPEKAKNAIVKKYNRLIEDKKTDVKKLEYFDFHATLFTLEANKKNSMRFIMGENSYVVGSLDCILIPWKSMFVEKIQAVLK